MNKVAISVSPDTPLIEVAKRMCDNDIGSIPIREDGRLTGTVTDRDIVCRGFATGKDLSTLTARDVMSPVRRHYESDKDWEEAIVLTESKKIFDGHKRMIEMLTLESV